MSVLKNKHNKSEQEILFNFTQGIHVDKFLFAEEIAVQKAWVNELTRINYFNSKEQELLLKEFNNIEKLMLNDEFPWKIEDEDIHMNIERFVTDNLGELGKKMHTGRSRNDLISTTLGLYTASTLKEVRKSIHNFIFSLSKKSEEYIDVIVPGITHLQNGQPVRFSHILNSHIFPLIRDSKKLEFAINNTLEYLPLGSAAMNGTHLDISLENLAKELGFRSPNYNSYDAVSNRDFFLEALDCYSTIAVHLSRLCEDFIIWSSAYSQLIKLPKNWSTGSSIMPNKRNPDVCELIRGKSAHIIAKASNAKILLKGLPTSYNTDLHELKEVYLQAFQILNESLNVFNFFVKEIEVDKKVAQKQLQKGHLLATDMANILAQQGTPFRESYTLMANWVNEAEKHNLQVHDLPQKECPKVSFVDSVESRKNTGGTSSKQVKKSLQIISKYLSDYKID